MKISEHLRKEFCVMDLQALDKEGAIAEIASVIAANGHVSDKAQFVKCILEREALGSTGIGHKVAIPHARTESVNGFVIGFGRCRQGIDFKALDGDTVNLVFLMGANPSELNLYLRLLAELSKLLMEESFRRELISSSNADEVIEIFRRYERV
jgi:PTS system fructose-specific IIC component